MEFLFNLLADSSAQGGKPANSWASILIWLIPIGLIVIFMVVSSKQRKKQQAEAENQINALKVGDEIMTIGNIYGVIVDIDRDNERFVIRTGTEENCSYLTIDKGALARIIPAKVDEPENAENVENAENAENGENAQVAEVEENTEPDEENGEVKEENKPEDEEVKD